MNHHRLRFSVLSLLAIACGDDGAADPQGTTTDSPTTETGSATLTTTDPATTEPTTTEPATTDPDTSGETTVADSSGTESSGTTDGGSTDTGEESIAVTISFAATIGGEAFACGTTYPGFGTSAVDVTPQDLRFFVQDLRLVRADDDTQVPLVLDVESPWQSETVALIDFEDGTGACSEAGGDDATRTLVVGTAPAGDYDGVVFTLGVPEDLNHADPLTLPLPLDAGSMTWGWLFGYKFTKFELLQVVDEGTAGFVAFHLGSTGCEGMPGVGDITCTLANRAEITLTDFDHATDTLVLDLDALFGGLDMTLDTQCHSFQGDTCPPMFESIGVDHATGLATAGQVAFAIE
ncbi:MAG: metallo-mystery pair system four-Cys motif protein [Deltaproteobacteria bacterium]|nr:metallo-mystery pair system four-Cys motif protein [Nannocystaceae bacterium]